MTWLVGIGAFLKRVPWQIYAGLALVLGAYIYGEVRFNAGKDIVLERLKEAERKAEIEAKLARAQADENAEERAREFEHEQDTLNEAIKEAEAAGDNPLDGLFRSLSETD